MSQTDSGSSIETSSIKSTVNHSLSLETFYSNTSVNLLADADEKELLTERNTSITSEDSQYRLQSFRSFETIDDCSPKTLKDWLKLAKILISQRENSQNKQLIAKKTDELQDFFYFLAIEYFSTDGLLVEFIDQKRNEFIKNWSNIINDCEHIFDLLISLIDDIHLDDSFYIV